MKTNGFLLVVLLVALQLCQGDAARWGKKKPGAITKCATPSAAEWPSCAANVLLDDSGFKQDATNKQCSTEILNKLASEAAKCSQRLAKVPMPPSTPPGPLWIATSAFKAVWNSWTLNGNIYNACKVTIKRNWRSAWEICKQTGMSIAMQKQKKGGTMLASNKGGKGSTAKKTNQILAGTKVKKKGSSAIA